MTALPLSVIKGDWIGRCVLTESFRKLLHQRLCLEAQMLRSFHNDSYLHVTPVAFTAPEAGNTASLDPQTLA